MKGRCHPGVRITGAPGILTPRCHAGDDNRDKSFGWPLSGNFLQLTILTRVSRHKRTSSKNVFPTFPLRA